MRDLADALLETVEAPDTWDEAIHRLCQVTGATRGLVTLRDLRTAEIHVPTDVAHTFGSPLIHGFGPEDVASYLSDYIDDDPWTEIEQLHPPIEPYAMSTFLPKQLLQSTRFWSWLEPLGIDDTIACEIGRTDRHRTVLNLFLPADGPDDLARTAIARLTQFLPLIRRSWAIGRRFRVRELSRAGLDSLLEAISRPTLIATCSGEIEACNKAARQRFSAWGIDLVPGATLRLPSWMKIEANPALGFVRPERVDGIQKSGLVAKINLYAASELHDGEQVRRILVTLDRAATESIWDVLELTPREKELVRHLAEGLTHKAAASEMGRSYPRIMQLWRSAREKLGVSDVTDLRVRHQVQTDRR